jgi:hypothetical protein
VGNTAHPTCRAPRVAGFQGQTFSMTCSLAFNVR